MENLLAMFFFIKEIIPVTGGVGAIDSPFVGTPCRLTPEISNYFLF